MRGRTARVPRGLVRYGPIAAGIAIAIITAVTGVGSALRTKFTVISTSLK
ncbi:Flp family type IVb pilin [Afipia sp. GAS231]|nr:Flp family type IVb pilin [Afipia sp. GAS231]SDM88237.1 pilus assembly protein Flp/PilA [Afipia sp. GAS231]